MNLLARAERDVLLRAAVAFGLIVAILVLACMSAAHAAPLQYCAADQSYRASCGAKGTERTIQEGAGRPAGCPRAWCGCWGRLQVGLTNPKYNLALAWLDFRHVGKRVGAWAVMRRKGGGHVGKVVALDASGNPVILSGNHGGRVGVGVYPARRIVAYVEPGR